MNEEKERKMRITVTKNGPYLVSGDVPLTKMIIGSDAEGNSEEWQPGEDYPAQPKYALCRCGHSSHKPFCDGTHKTVKFDGSETAGREPYEKQAESMDGPTMRLTDAKDLCAFARFCDPHGSVWSQVEETDDPEMRAHFVRQVGNCPSGRLVAWDKKTGKPVEPELSPSIALIEDPLKGVMGPIWVRGGIPVESADGFAYEVRNRQTLCRCGRSRNKPFCDGSHAGG